jgi:hypothetical protein
VPGLKAIDDSEAEKRTIVAAELVLEILSEWKENGVPCLVVFAEEDEDEDVSIFTAVRDIHNALKEQNKILAAGVQKLGLIADVLKSPK